MLPSLTLDIALKEKGYFILARHSVRRKNDTVTFTHYHCTRDEERYELLMMVIDDAEGNEDLCQLYTPFGETYDLKATIDAIP